MSFRTSHLVGYVISSLEGQDGEGMRNLRKSDTWQSIVPKIFVAWKLRATQMTNYWKWYLPSHSSLSSHQCPRSHFRDTTNQLAPHSRQQHGTIHKDRTPICLAKQGTLSWWITIMIDRLTKSSCRYKISIKSIHNFQLYILMSDLLSAPIPLKQAHPMGVSPKSSVLSAPFIPFKTKLTPKTIGVFGHLQKNRGGGKVSGR